MHISFYPKVTKLLAAVAIVLSGGSWGQPSSPTLDARALIESCKSVKSDTSMNVCLAYLQGFLDASPHIVEEDQLASDYVIRAIKTRAPKKDVIAKSISNAKYCVPEKDFLPELVNKLAAVKYDPGVHQSSSSLVISVLEANYSCNP